MLLASFNTAWDTPRNSDKFIVVLDAGHGGHDPGNLGNGYLEKNIALNIVLKVGAILEKHPDIQVIYTRKEDKFVDLFVRGEIANKAKADLFVSVHCDSHTSDAHGAGTFVLGLHANKQNFEIAKKENSVIYLEDNYEVRYADYDINSPESVIGLTIMQEEFLDQSIALATDIQDNMAGGLKRNDRKVKQAGFIVLHQTFMPSVLIETGFLTNKDEGAYLNSEKGQSDIGTAIAEAILKYKNSVQSNVAPTTSQVVKQVATEPEKNDKSVENTEIGTPTNTVLQPEQVAINGVSTDSEIDKATADVTTETKEILAVDELPIQKEQVSSKSEGNPGLVNEKSSPALPNILFKVQLLASSKNLSLNSNTFKGLGDLSKEPYANLFRYMYGSTTSFKAAEKLKANAELKGYTNAYIVAYKDGKRIPLPEALKYVSD
ncbi:MAG: N-acetylmuramoyl-L-alanine amidase [Maribacter sp.]|nr:N-acetylmuramoyl-L-alanine amidase [Maribacter sp.]